MPSYSGPSASRSDEIAGTLRLLATLTLAAALMVFDHRGGWLSAFRSQAELAVQPLWQVAGLPAKFGQSVREDAATRARLAEENEKLRNALLINKARIARLQAAAAENARLRGLLGVAEQGGFDVQLAPILDIALDPTRQRLILDVGAAQGVRTGQPVIDAGGLVGQVIDTKPSTAVVLLLTDPDHAVPVAVARNGIRLVVYGRGDRLELANVPMSADVKVGDLLVTSGLGGRFPPGFPVGTIVRLQPNESRAFLVGDLQPAAQLDRGRDVLLLKSRKSRESAKGPESGMENQESVRQPPQPSPGSASGTAAAATPAAGEDANASRVSESRIPIPDSQRSGTERQP